MTWNEKRLAKRINLTIALRFRPVTTTPVLQQKAESVNVSHTGVYFVTDYPVEVGSPLEMFLQMPKEVTGKTAADLRCTARVVHVQPNCFPGGKSGVGVHIERYDVLSTLEHPKAGAIPNVRAS